MNNIWRSAQYNTSTKLNRYQSCVVSTNLYGSERCRITGTDHSKLRSFHMTCLHRLLFTLNFLARKPYEESVSKCNQEDLGIIKKRLRWRWQILRKNPQSTRRTALDIIQKARERQEHHGEGQWRASSKPCSRLRDK